MELTPELLAPDEYPTWLNKHLTNPDLLQPLYQPYPADLLETYPVSDRVNVLRIYFISEHQEQHENQFE